MQQFHNDLIASPDDGGLLGARHADTNDMIISDTILRSLAPPQLLPMTDNHKIMCGCAICNTSKYMQESLNTWRQKQLKIMKYKADNSHVRENMNELKLTNQMLTTPFQTMKLVIRVAKMQQIFFYLSTNDECQLPNWKCVLQKCTDCTYIALPGVERDSLN